MIHYISIPTYIRLASNSSKQSARHHTLLYAGLASAVAITYLTWDSIRSTSFHKWASDAAMPIVRKLSSERAHRLGVLLAKYHLTPIDISYYPELETDACGMHFPNCVGLAAGFDKNAEAIEALHDTGFGFIEVGGVTPLPQPGNPSPRMFRIPEAEAIINRFGLNNEGHEKIVPRVRQWYIRHKEIHNRPLLGVNLAENKGTDDSIHDYNLGIQHLGPFSDFLVINVSCPNQVGTLELQAKEQLESIATKTIQTSFISHKPRLLIKISPDLSYEQKQQIAEIALKYPIDGLVISNTTVSRPDSIQSPSIHEKGGLSGKPLKALSTQSIYDMYELTHGQVQIIGVGGISNGQDAYEKIKAGASVVEVYSALVYHGIGLVTTIKKELVELLKKDGFDNISQAVGTAHQHHKD